MASGFGSAFGGDLNWANNTKACGWGEVYQSINYDNRSVTVTVNARAGCVQRNVRRSVNAGEQIYQCYGYNTWTRARVGDQNSRNEGTDGVALSAAYYRMWGIGEQYRVDDGWVNGSGRYAASASKTYWYDVNGTAITDSWAAAFGSDYVGGESRVGGNFTTDSISPAYTKPTVSSASNLTGTGAPNQARSQVMNPSNWGTNSVKGWFEIWNNNSSVAVAASTDDDPVMTWTLYASSTSPTACAINIWHGRTINNHSLYSETGNLYIATPSAPILSLTGQEGTSPQLNFTSTINYRGGGANSATCDNASLAKYQYGILQSDQSGVPSSLTDYVTSDKTFSASISKDSFMAGKSYKLYVRAIGGYGGTSYTNSSVVYCPSSVYGNLASKTSTSLTIRAGANNAGTIGSASGGTLACYQLKWGTSESSLTNTLPVQTSDTFTITGLTPNQTVYYQITAWNIYGLNAVSNVTSQTTIPRYMPEIGTITPSYNTSATTPEELATSLNIVINHTGGLTIDELPVTSITVEKKPSFSTTWTIVRTEDNLNLLAGDDFTFTNALTGVQDNTGNYELKITVSNGTDSTSQIFVVYAPTFLSYTVSIPTNEFVQFQSNATVSTNGGAAIWRYSQDLDYYTRLKEVFTSETSVSIKSPKVLEFNTTYPLTTLLCTNLAGVYNRSSNKSITTPKRFNFYGVKGTNIKKGTEILTHNGVEKEISEVYYIKKNALGNVQIGDNLKHRPLQFITQPLHLHSQAATEARITFTNGKYITCNKTDYGVKFGFCTSGGSFTQTFFEDRANGASVWNVNRYTLPNENLIVDSITSDNNMGLNVCPAFSTTEVLPAEREPEIIRTITTPTGQINTTTLAYVQVQCYTDNHAVATYFIVAQTSGSYVQYLPVVFYAGGAGTTTYSINYRGPGTYAVYSKAFSIQPGQTYPVGFYAANTSAYPNYRYNATVQIPNYAGGQ